MLKRVNVGENGSFIDQDCGGIYTSAQYKNLILENEKQKKTREAKGLAARHRSVVKIFDVCLILAILFQRGIHWFKCLKVVVLLLDQDYNNLREVLLKFPHTKAEAPVSHVFAKLIELKHLLDGLDQECYGVELSLCLRVASF